MNDPFALDLTIILLLLGVGAAMVAGNLAAFFNKNENKENIYMRRTIFLITVGLLITIWSIASLINR
ncbi:MAG: hypothetical protein ACJ0GA_00540 [Candidatus Actinomarina sp.]|jgi:uncharacterized membrane protein YeiB|tara:strand:- start:369 stop:569 length:201 start_codon:yes stop_codon:yes gene_type:complete